MEVAPHAAAPLNRPVIVAATYNNERTLPDILRRIAAHSLPILVINDGSTDSTPQILARFKREFASLAHVIVHPANRGKAAALRTGFEHAARLGFTHAITLDTDGQLKPEQIPQFAELAARCPNALIVGWRDVNAPGYPRKSSLGRFVSNTLIRWESGLHVSDSQCGFRVYPLSIIQQLKLRCGRYAMETEVLTRAGWAGVSVRELPVDCIYDVPDGRVSHFRPWRDSVNAFGMHFNLMSRALMPIPIKRLGTARTGLIYRRLLDWFSPRRAIRAMRKSRPQRARFAAGLATGVFIANLPLYGFHSILSLFTARWMRFHPLSVLAGSHVATFPVGPLLIVGGIALGRWILHGISPLAPVNLAGGRAALIREMLLEWTVGGMALGAILAWLTFMLSMLLMNRLPARSTRRPADSASDPAARAQALDRAVAE
jgi:glycosyltransferase involved in cell wall biosynthesis